MNQESGPKPSLPEGYVLPQVWEPKNLGGTFGALNRPVAGARKEADLPKGEHPIQLYSLGTPNGQKVTILLEELGIEYDAWLTNIGADAQDQFGSGFVAVNPNSKIPAMLDYSVTPPLRIFESGSILLYLAEKYGKFIPKDLAKRTECLNWLFWQVGSAPYVGGGFGHFYKYAPVTIEYAIDRFTMEAKRQLDLLDKQLSQHTYIAGEEYTIADMAIPPWVTVFDSGYNADKFVRMESYKHLQRWMALLLAREGVKRGRRVNGLGPDAVRYRHSAKDFQ